MHAYVHSGAFRTRVSHKAMLYVSRASHVPVKCVCVCVRCECGMYRCVCARVPVKATPTSSGMYVSAAEKAFYFSGLERNVSGDSTSGEHHSCGVRGANFCRSFIMKNKSTGDLALTALLFLTSVSTYAVIQSVDRSIV